MRNAIILSAAVLIASPIALRAAELKLATVFSDHMVLQRDKPVPIWGVADAGETVTVAFAGQKNSAQADATGKWTVKLAPLTASAEPRELRILADHHPTSVVVHDVLVGEVWLGSGQSNMARSVSDARDFSMEKSLANWPLLRMFKENSKPAKAPQADAHGQWTVCSSNTVGGYSATLYFFGRDLHRELQVPVGLINSSVGGTPIESWLAEESQSRMPELKPAMEKYRKENEWLGSPAAAAEFERQPGPQNPWWSPPKQLEARGDLGNLFNGKIAPLIPYALRGVVWYQGEQNAAPGMGQYYQYELPLLVNDWRAHWHEELPFAWVQLPNYATSGEWETGWMLVREAMLKTLHLPHTGMAITVDIGEPKDIHPKNKQDVGHRLALWALGDVYGVKVPATSGPLPAHHEVRGAEMVLSFTHAEGGLLTKAGNLKGFLIAADDRQWKPAQARIQNEQVLVSSPEVANPVAARYDWAANPDGNLYNGAGLPASPFRTDDWPLSEAAHTTPTPPTK